MNIILELFILLINGCYLLRQVMFLLIVIVMKDKFVFVWVQVIYFNYYFCLLFIFFFGYFIGSWFFLSGDDLWIIIIVCWLDKM